MPSWPGPGSIGQGGPPSIEGHPWKGPDMAPQGGFENTSGGGGNFGSGGSFGSQSQEGGKKAPAGQIGPRDRGFFRSGRK